MFRHSHSGEFTEKQGGKGGFLHYLRKKPIFMKKVAEAKLRISVPKEKFEKAKIIIHQYLLSERSPFDSFKVIDMHDSQMQLEKVLQYQSELKEERHALEAEIENLNMQLAAVTPLHDQSIKQIETRFSMNASEIYDYWLASELSDTPPDDEKYQAACEATRLWSQQVSLQSSLKECMTRMATWEKENRKLAESLSASSLEDFERLMKAGQWTLYIAHDPSSETYYEIIAAFLGEITTALAASGIQPESCPPSDMPLADYLSGRVDYDKKGSYVSVTSEPSEDTLNHPVLSQLARLLAAAQAGGILTSFAGCRLGKQDAFWR